MCREKTPHQRLLMTAPGDLIPDQPMKKMTEAAAIPIDDELGIPLVDQPVNTFINVRRKGIVANIECSL
jgi:hypothetical protein